MPSNREDDRPPMTHWHGCNDQYNRCPMARTGSKVFACERKHGNTLWFLGLAGSHGTESESGTGRETWAPHLILAGLGGARHGVPRATACPYLSPSTIRGAPMVRPLSALLLNVMRAWTCVNRPGKDSGDLMGTKAGRTSPHTSLFARASQSGTHA